MKTNTFFICCLFLCLLIRGTIHAQSQLIHYWHFNTTLPLNHSGGIPYISLPSDYSQLGRGWFVFQKYPGTVADTSYADNTAGDTINQRTGFGGCCGSINNAIRIHNPCDSMQILLFIPTVHFKNIAVQFETKAFTPFSPHYQLYDYSLDSGNTFSGTGLSAVFDTAGTDWEKVSLNLSADTLTNNNKRLVFRVRFAPVNTGLLGLNSFDNITVEGDSINCKASTPVITQNGLVITSSPAYAYQWYINNKPVPGAVSQSYTVTLAGDYYVSVTDPSGCTAISATIPEGPAGISSLEASKEFQISISPDPVTNGKARLDFSLTKESLVSYFLYTITGQLAATGKELLPPGKQYSNLDLSQLPPGMYLCQINAGNIHRVLKVIISRP